MNNQLIEKLISSNDEPCPPFTFKNPLLDRKVAAALSKSFVKMLKLSKQNSNINNNLRLSILENIRRMCQTEPEDHARIDENFTEVMTKFYEMQIKESGSDCVDGPDNTDKELDAFLVGKMKEIDLTSCHGSSVNPEIIQSLINLNENGVHLEILSNEIIHWNIRDNMFKHLVNDLWNQCNCSAIVNVNLDDVSLKMKAEIEKVLLNSCHRILSDTISIEDVLSDSSVTEVVKACSNSANCFQICSGILNFIFIMTNFDKKILNFISFFVKNVKMNCPLPSFSVLYPLHLSSTVVLLDIDINTMPEGFREKYIEFAMKYLHKIHSESENDFVLLLSHFQDWFDIYYAAEAN